MSTDTSTPDVRPTDHTGLRVLSIDECLERLDRTAVGRIAFVLDGEVTVLPVVHTRDGVDVCFRTTGSSKVGAAVDHDRVAYQVDGFDARTRTGWSVLVQGTAVLVTQEADVRRLDLGSARSWVPQHEHGYQWIRVRTASITGRALG
ncbi:pyridoxamine 5'-phosphate oxidase family protein [Pedococcus sp. 5OH_020]|uniref:pyridoxamine 5'-phosphate oxidase family protein n=1 Tax=Pedococcus sp. 5OH_020 TaxID=2989814 RepID=UPI0022E9EEB9|nr:pyridoxamine 5'-phosphate oxidase family protein [Pedococcus sp. 5OH_020]